MNYQEKSRFGIIIKLISAIGGIIVGFIICRFFFTPFRMPDSSMEPNVRTGDMLFVLKHITPKRGDIVLIESPIESGRVLIKRVVATEGDTVEVRNKTFHINNTSYDFRWKTKSSDTRIFPMNFTFRDNMPAVKLSRNQYFVLNDDLDRGFDSRTLGVIPGSLIIGRVAYKY
jgi:signal peptidase I